MQQDLLANGNYASYLAQALTPPFGSAGMMSGYGTPQGFAPQFGNPGFGQFGQGQYGQGQFGQGLPGQGISGIMPGGAIQPGSGYQGLQPGLGQPFAAQQQQQLQIAATLHQLAHQAATQAVLGQQVGATLHQLAQHVASQGVMGQQIAAVLNQLAQQCAWQAQTAAQHRYGGVGMYGGLGTQAIGGLNGPFAGAHPAAYGFGGAMPPTQAWGLNRPQQW